MKSIIFVIAILVLSASSSFAQQRPRYYYDNSPTQKDVSAISEKRFIGRAPEKGHQNPYTPSPHVRRDRDPRPLRDTKYVARTVQATMTVYDGHQRPPATARPIAAPMVILSAGKSLKGYSTGNSAIDSYIVESSRRYNIDPLLIYAQMHQESSFKVHARSHKGASGLMQLMPPTARRMGVTDIYDPRQNIDGGVKYMRLLLDMFGGDLKLALAGYNAGEGAVMKYGRQIPPYAETRDYVKRISTRYQSMSGSTTTARYAGKNRVAPLTPYRVRSDDDLDADISTDGRDSSSNK